ncbi:hypothetical protein JT55_17050 [Rhodovulum sp. NI22]|nr:hypothetical protein JT55_17050 [Rhodovulum sp. NI22]
MIAGVCPEDVRYSCDTFTFTQWIVIGEQSSIIQAQCLEQRAAKLWFDRTDGNVLIVRANIRPVKVPATVKKVLASWLAMLSGLVQAFNESIENGRSINDCRIDNLAFPASFCVENGSEQPKGKQHTSSAHIPDKGWDCCRQRTVLFKQRQRPRDGKEIQIVAGHSCKRPILSPAGHSCVDEALVNGLQRIRAQTEALHDPGPKPLNNRIGMPDQFQYDIPVRFGFEIQGQNCPISLQDIEPASGRRLPLRGGGFAFALNRDDIRTEIGQQHASERGRSQCRELDDFQTGKRPCRLFF